MTKSTRPTKLVRVLEESRPSVEAAQLYEKRDGSDVDATQIHARANKYRHLFEKDGSRIGLVSG
jgi:hypothetical protein